MADRRYSTQRWVRLRAQALIRYGYHCARANCPNEQTKLHADHILEVEDGGSFWDLNNIQILCKPHHDEKSAGVRAGRGEPVSPNR